MATRDDTGKTLFPQGKFIRPYDRFTVEAQARAERAEAIRQAARAVGATVRGWFAAAPGAGRRPGIA